MAAQRWRIEARVVELALKEPFVIARRRWDSVPNVFVTVTYGGVMGVGEVSPEDDPHRVASDLTSLDLSSLDSPYALESVGDLLPPSDARCALDIALHDLAAKSAVLSVSELLGLSGRPAPETSVTAPIAGIDDMVARARALAGHPVLKTKVGFDGDVDVVAAIRDVFPGRLRVDANEGWSEEEAAERLKALAGYDIELCEQPIVRGQRDALGRVTQASPIPVYADEDVRTAADVARLAGAVDGVNLKLRKAGGIRETVRAVHVARALGMGVMLGCDLESGVATTAAASLASLADFVDVDGPLLLADDPCPGVAYERGSLILPAGPGLGVNGAPPW